jgi:phosphosulfolactate phosphohydrolase-like enzyme
VAAAGVEHVFAASLVCASATAAAVRRLSSQPPTYVISGRFQDAPDAGYDDLLTAQLIERARLGEPLRAKETAATVAGTAEAARTLALGPPHADPDDIAYAVAVDVFGFAMRVEAVGALQKLVPVSA